MLVGRLFHYRVWISCERALKIELQPELDDTWIVDGRRYTTELRRRVQVVGREAKLRVVKQVEKLHPEIEAGAFPRQCKALDHRKVGIDEVGAGKRSSGGIADFTGRSGRKRARIKINSGGA